MLDEAERLFDGNKNTNKPSFFKRIAGFNEDNLGAARVYILVRDTGTAKTVPPSCQYGEEIFTFPCREPQYNIPQALTDEHLGNEDYEKYKKYYKRIEDKFKGKDSDTNVFTYSGIGDTLLHPTTDSAVNDAKEVESNTHNTECVFMPSNTYYGEEEGEQGLGGYDGYPCKDKNKVYGPYRKAFFHSRPGELFDNEFSDIRDYVTNGESVVFFGYGFSGSGKTYTPN